MIAIIEFSDESVAGVSGKPDPGFGVTSRPAAARAEEGGGGGGHVKGRGGEGEKRGGAGALYGRWGGREEGWWGVNVFLYWLSNVTFMEQLLPYPLRWGLDRVYI